LNFRHLLEANDLAEDILKAVNAHLARKGLLLKQGSIVDATFIPAPSSTKNAEGERDPEMHQTKKGNQWHFGMKAHIGVDADSGLVHTVTTTAANEADVEQVADLLHGKEKHVWADSGYRGAPTRVNRENLQWHIAARPSDIAKLPEGRTKAKVKKTERSKASIRAKVEHPFRVIKRQFGLAKVRFRGLAKNTAHVVTLFCAVEPVDGAKAVDGGSPSENSVRHRKGAEVPQNSKWKPHFVITRRRDAQNVTTIKACSDLPQVSGAELAGQCRGLVTLRYQT